MIPSTDTKSIQVVNDTLERLDKLAHSILKAASTLGITNAAAFHLAQQIDKTADALELDAFGPASLKHRQLDQYQRTASARRAQVIQKQTDEPYMGTFANPMAPIQVESDEPYMAAYRDDQSSGVIHGTSSSGRALAPGH